MNADLDSPETGGRAPAGLRALVVDDEPPLVKVVARYLEREGFEVATAGDGERAVELARELAPDVIVLDLMLPGIDGIEACRRIRAFSDAYIVMLTARVEEIDRIVGLSTGADDYVTKPFSPGELMARVRAMLRRAELIRQTVREDRQATAGETLTRGMLRLDTAAHQATLDGQPLDLSPTEFALLHLLLRSPGRAFSRAYLLETVWREAYIGGDRSVDNVVLRLRKKLGPLGDEIETVWGIGYRLRPEKQ